MKTVQELIAEKAALVIASYPTYGVNLADLIDITLELCADFERYPTARTVKSVIKRAGFYKRGARYYPANESVLALPQATASNSGATASDVEILVSANSTRNRVDWRRRVYGGYRGA